jgi:WhiB family redox-sensing transcriptional regulator
MSQLQWMDDALCREIGPELFFLEDSGVPYEARKVCALCPVQDECLRFALTADVEGIWAGTTPSQRRALRRGVA